LGSQSTLDLQSSPMSWPQAATPSETESDSKVTSAKLARGGVHRVDFTARLHTVNSRDAPGPPVRARFLYSVRSVSDAPTTTPLFTREARPDPLSDRGLDRRRFAPVWNGMLEEFRNHLSRLTAASVVTDGKHDIDGLSSLVALLDASLRTVDPIISDLDDVVAELGQMAERALAPKQVAAQFLLEIADGAAQRRLRDVTFLGGLGEIQRFRHRQEIADLMHFHAGSLPRKPFGRWILIRRNDGNSRHRDTDRTKKHGATLR